MLSKPHTVCILLKFSVCKVLVNHTLCAIVLAYIVITNSNCSRVFPRVCPSY